MTKQWIVVAESSRARIYERNGPNQALREVEDLVCPAARQPGRELQSDRAPRIFQSAGGHGHQVAAREDPHELELEKFARDIARHLESARIQHNYQALYLAAAPEFLGILRQHLGDEVGKLVVRSLDRNLVDCAEDQIRAHLDLP